MDFASAFRGELDHSLKRGDKSSLAWLAGLPHMVETKNDRHWYCATFGGLPSLKFLRTLRAYIPFGLVLMGAIHNDQPEVIEWICKLSPAGSGGWIREERYCGVGDVWLEVAGTGHVRTAEILHRHNVPISKETASMMLSLATSGGYVQLAKWCVEKGLGQLQDHDYEAVRVSTLAGNEELLDYFESAGVTADGCKALDCEMESLARSCNVIPVLRWLKKMQALTDTKKEIELERYRFLRQASANAFVQRRKEALRNLRKMNIH